MEEGDRREGQREGGGMTGPYKTLRQRRGHKSGTLRGSRSRKREVWFCPGAAHAIRTPSLQHCKEHSLIWQ